MKTSNNSISFLFLLISHISFSQGGSNGKPTKNVIETRGMPVESRVPEKQPERKPANTSETNKPGRGDGYTTENGKESKNIMGAANNIEVSEISFQGAKRLQNLSTFMQMLATIQTARLLKEFLEFPRLGTFDKLEKIANNDIKEMLQQLADMPDQQRNIASHIVDEIIKELSLAENQPPVSQDKNKRDQMWREIKLWNKFNDGLNYVKPKTNANSTKINSENIFLAGNSGTSSSHKSTYIAGTLAMKIKESDGLQALSPNMTTITDITIYPIFFLKNVPCWGVDMTVNLYVYFYEHDPSYTSTAPFSFDKLEKPVDYFILMGHYKVPGLRLPNSKFLLSKNSGLYLPDFYYSGYCPTEFFITIDNEKFKNHEGLFDFYFYYTLTVDSITSSPSNVYKIVHSL